MLIELLAWQFASPVRWIETQDMFFGKLGVERFIEIGVGQAPTVANLASQTLKQPGRHGGPVEVLNFERDSAAVFGTDEEMADLDEDEAPVEASAPDASSPRCFGGHPRPDSRRQQWRSTSCRPDLRRR